MSFPDFFDRIPAATLYDPLAAFLGAPEDGMLIYHYADAVRLAGHSCPTVAGAWLMIGRALKLLWPDAVPVRGMMQIGFPHGQGEGVTGVMASVAGLVAGAAGEGGFKGIGGDFSRKDLLRFGLGGDHDMRVLRTDAEVGVALRYNPQIIPPDPAMREALQAILAGDADEALRPRFAALWQERVRRILIDHHDDPELITHAFF